MKLARMKTEWLSEDFELPHRVKTLAWMKMPLLAVSDSPARTNALARMKTEGRSGSARMKMSLLAESLTRTDEGSGTDEKLSGWLAQDG